MFEPRRHEDHEAHVFEDISRDVVDCCFQVHKKLGTGLLENVYEEPVCIELEKKGLKFEQQKEFPIFYEGKKLKYGCRLDILVEDKIVLELKAVEKLLPVHQAQIITYLKISGLKTGFLMNFNDPYFKSAIKRYVL